MTQKQHIEVLIEEFKKSQEEFKAKAMASLKKLFADTFEAFPETKFISWTQFAPYFNDGDECIFRVHPITASNANPEDVRYGEYIGDEDTDESFWVYDADYGSYDVPSNEAEDAFDSLSNLIQSDELEDILRSTFGNHVRVIATREGFTTESYDHD
jgi:hypothetical protein